MLLNLSSKLSFPCKNENGGLKCNKKWGPTFGAFDLQIKLPLNRYAECKSFANSPVYKIPKVNGDINQLTNEKCDKNGRSDSTLWEIEVWEIIGKK